MKKFYMIPVDEVYLDAKTSDDNFIELMFPEIGRLYSQIYSIDKLKGIDEDLKEYRKSQIESKIYELLYQNDIPTYMYFKEIRSGLSYVVLEEYVSKVQLRGHKDLVNKYQVGEAIFKGQVNDLTIEEKNAIYDALRNFKCGFYKKGKCKVLKFKGENKDERNINSK